MPGDKPLFTPGPLTTTVTVKQAIMHDLAEADAVLEDIDRRLNSAVAP